MEEYIKTLVDIIEGIKNIVGSLFSGTSMDIKLRKSKAFIVLDGTWIFDNSTSVRFEKLIELDSILKLNYKLKLGLIESNGSFLYCELVNNDNK